jgi:hypothetical protein
LDSVLRQPVDATPFFNVADSLAMQREVATLLVSWGAGEIVALARKYYSDSRFFAVSSLGERPTDSNRVSPRGVRPYRITDPFLWLLSEFRFVETVRRVLYDPASIALYVV